MYASYAAKASAGSKPVAHQAPIVLSARLRRRDLGTDPVPTFSNGDQHVAEVNELAFVASNDHNPYPEPEYFTAVNTVNTNFRVDKPNTRAGEAKLKACWKQYSFLGVVQTPGNNKGLSRHDHGALGGNTNVVHAGGTMTTINHGTDHIKVNDTVAWYFPEKKIADGTPRCWESKAGGASRLRAGVFKVLPGSDLYTSARDHGAIIGRAISAATPGGQLDLILTV